MNHKPQLVLVALFIVVFFTGCPRYAYISAYNNTSTRITIKTENKEMIVEPEGNATFTLGWSFSLSSDLGEWVYDREVPYGGEDGPFFDGTLRIQIEEDGSLFALKVGEEGPQASFTDQPIGFPLRPKTHGQQIVGGNE